MPGTFIWKVRAEGNGILPATGQQDCYDSEGMPVECSGSGQDGEYRFGVAWPQPRFTQHDNTVEDHLSGLHWSHNANLMPAPVNWVDAFMAVEELNRQDNTSHWRLPNINELESLVDCVHAKPALSRPLVFDNVQDFYWSSSTRMYEADWAWVLYLDKGAVGVGQKHTQLFCVAGMRLG